MQETGPYQNMCKINGKVADNSVEIEGPKIQIGWGSAAASDLFSYVYVITGGDISQYKETCELLLYYQNRRGIYKRLY